MSTRPSVGRAKTTRNSTKPTPRTSRTTTSAKTAAMAARSSHKPIAPRAPSPSSPPVAARAASPAGSPIAPRAPSPAAPAVAKGTVAVGMDAANARRLIDAWRAKDKQAQPIRMIPAGGFFAGHGHASVELEYDPRLRLLIARRSPGGGSWSQPPDKSERERVAAMAEAKAAKLRGTTAEIAELRSKPNKWFVVLRRDFAESTITDAAFLSALDDLTKLMVVWRA